MMRQLRDNIDIKLILHLPLDGCYIHLSILHNIANQVPLETTVADYFGL